MNLTQTHVVDKKFNLQAIAPPTNMPSEIPAFCKTILANTIAKTLLNEITTGLSKLSTKPHLCGILANDDPAAQVYADWTGKTCKDK